MAKELCILHANCQGDALKQLLEASPDFNAKFTITHLRNYVEKDLEQGLLDASGLFLHQYLVEKWGAISTSQVLKRLPSSTPNLCIPNCCFMGYWPTWADGPQIPGFTDTLLENLLRRNLEQKALLKLYQQASPELVGNVEQIAETSLRTERNKEKHTPIKYVDWIEERWRNQPVFLTFNHPGVPLLVHVAQQILQYLGMAPIPKQFADNFIHPHNEFWLPIHPAFAQRLHLSFANAQTRYPCFGANLTHLEYTLCYLACRANNFSDLPSALAASGKKAILPIKDGQLSNTQP